MKSVYCAVRTGSLNKAVCAASLNAYFIFDIIYQFQLKNIVRCITIVATAVPLNYTHACISCDVMYLRHKYLIIKHHLFKKRGGLV
jgi:hypothetical protein